MTREHLCVMALHHMDGVGPVQTRRILEFFGNAADFFDRGEADLLAGRKGTTKMKELLGERARDKAFRKAESEFREAASRGIVIHTVKDESYPERLRHIPDLPIVLFSTSNIDLNSHRMIAIVGTRKCSSRGEQWTRKFVEGLADLKVVVVSGMARGIDAMAHRAAMDVGLPTVAVCAHGLSHVYPRVHKNLAEDISRNGALLSEFSWSTKPHTLFFPRRNRIVAGLSDAVVVVESFRRGGSLITARLGQEYNREVLAVPGRSEDEEAMGCNDLIAGQRAQLIRSADEFRSYMGWGLSSVPAPKPRKFPDHWKPVVEALRSATSLHIDELRDKVSEGGLSTILLEMECDEALKVLPGSNYVLT